MNTNNLFFESFMSLIKTEDSNITLHTQTPKIHSHTPNPE